MTEAPHTDIEKIDLLRKIINDSTAAFLVTRSSDALHGRPMATAEVEEGIEAIWFATQRDCSKVDEIAADDRVFLGYTNGTGSEWASINGHAQVVDDREKIRELWNPYWKNWFEGPEDPRIILIRVTPEHAEYWDAGSRVVQLMKFAIAAVTGGHLSEGKHGEVSLGRRYSEDDARV